MKNFKFYAVSWGILLALYNVIVFVVRGVIPAYEVKYDATFWLSWAFVTLSFVGQLLCAYVAFKPQNKEKLFLSIPLVTESFSAVVAMTVISGVLMLIPGVPAFVSAPVCVLILALSAVTVLKAKAAGEIVSEVDRKVKEKTLFIKSLTVDAECLVSHAKTAEIKALTKKVYEAVRYSDPMSSEALSAIETQITLKFASLSQAVEADDVKAVETAAAEVIVLISDRNKKCKVLK